MALRQSYADFFSLEATAEDEDNIAFYADFFNCEFTNVHGFWFNKRKQGYYVVESSRISSWKASHSTDVAAENEDITVKILINIWLLL